MCIVDYNVIVKNKYINVYIVKCIVFINIMCSGKKRRRKKFIVY